MSTRFAAPTGTCPPSVPVCSNPLCAAPLRPRVYRSGNPGFYRYLDGTCHGCVRKWIRRGRPQGGPTAIDPRVKLRPPMSEKVRAALAAQAAAEHEAKLARQEDALWLVREQGYTKDRAAQQMKLSVKSIERYLRAA